MAEDLGEDDIVGLVFGFELVAANGAVGASEVAWFPGLAEGAEETAETYLGSWGPVVVLTAFAEGKLLRVRRESRAWTSFLWIVGIQGNEIGLVAVNALVVGGVPARGN